MPRFFFLIGYVVYISCFTSTKKFKFKLQILFLSEMILFPKKINFITFNKRILFLFPNAGEVMKIKYKQRIA